MHESSKEEYKPESMNYNEGLRELELERAFNAW